MKYDFIAQLQQEYAVSLLWRVLEVSVSGYYAWKQRARSQRQQEDELLALRIQQVHQDSHHLGCCIIRTAAVSTLLPGIKLSLHRLASR